MPQGFGYVVPLENENRWTDLLAVLISTDPSAASGYCMRCPDSRMAFDGILATAPARDVPEAVVGGLGRRGPAHAETALNAFARDFAKLVRQLQAICYRFTLKEVEAA